MSSTSTHGCSGVQHAFDELGGSGVVAGFQVGGDRDVDGAGDAGDACEGVLQAHVLTITGPHGVRDGMAADGQGLEAGGDRGLGGPGVPHGGQHHRGRTMVQGEKGFGAFAQ